MNRLHTVSATIRVSPYLGQGFTSTGCRLLLVSINTDSDQIETRQLLE